MHKIARSFGLAESLQERIAAGLPVYGTCAGLILLADTVLDAVAGQQTFGGLDVTVRRNAFGPQADSFEADLDVEGFDGPPVHAAFIRAPIVERVGEKARAIATVDDGRVVAVRQGNLLGTSFHPEITGETRFHRAFLDTVVAAA
jgi:5'-phosphate synthase pdxT subunit